MAALPSSASQSDAAVKALQSEVDEWDEDLKQTFEVMHAGYAEATLLRFLKAREFDVTKAAKMLKDSLQWRIKNDVDNILARPIVGEQYKRIRNSQLYGMTGFDKEGRPVLSARVGLSSQDPLCKLEEYLHSHIQHNEYRDRVLLHEASRRMGRPVTGCVKIYDMTGLKLTQLHRMTMHKAVASVDDLNYPEKAEVYFIVNAPLVFSTAWKAVKSLLQERTKKKVQVLHGNGLDDLLQIMDEDVLPHFVRYAPKEGLGSAKNLAVLNSHPALVDPSSDCCHPSHPFHQNMQQYLLQQQAAAVAAGKAASTEVLEVEVDPMALEGGEEMDVASVVEKTLEEVELQSKA